MHLRSIVWAFAAVVLYASFTRATVYSASLIGSTNWSEPAAWHGGIVPNEPGAVILFSNMTQTLTYTVDGTYTAGVFIAYSEANAYISVAGSAANGIVITNPFGRAQAIGITNSGTSTIYLPRMILLQELDLISSSRTVRVQREVVGTPDIHAYAIGGTILFYNTPSPDFLGTLHCYGAGTTPVEFRQVCLSNAAAIVLHDGVRMGKPFGFPTFITAPVVIRDGGSIYVLGIGISNLYQCNGPVTLEGGALTNIAANSGGSMLYFTGAFSGTGDVVVLNNTGSIGFTNAWTGSISPGLPIGELTITDARTNVFIGMNEDPVTLNVEVAGSEHDILALKNMKQPLDLTNIHLIVSGTPDPDTTYWVLTCDAGFINDFSSVSGVESIVMEADRIGVIVPEPGLALLAAGAAIWRARRLWQAT